MKDFVPPRTVAQAAAELVRHLRDLPESNLAEVVEAGVNSTSELVRKVAVVAHAIDDERWVADVDLDGLDPFQPKVGRAVWRWSRKPWPDELHPEDAEAIRRLANDDQDD